LRIPGYHLSIRLDKAFNLCARKRSMSYYGFRPYVPVAQRRARAAAHALKLAKKEKRTLAPIARTGRRTIAESFWGKAWCENLEAYSDFANRLPRGRTYARNGSIIDLQMGRGKVTALVSGSEIYRVTIDIKTLPAAAWSRIKEDCARSIDSLMDLLQGRFDEGIMRRLTQRDGGLFPQPREVQMDCSCPDWAGMCKHVAATLYGVGTRLDTRPELLFTLRNVDHLELLGRAVDADNLDRTLKGRADSALAGSDLGAIFGIELDTANDAPAEAGKGKGDVGQDALRGGRPKAAATRGKAKKAAGKAQAEPAVRRSKKPARAAGKTPASAGAPSSK
jgi:uncharacterized Zn finger protein